MIRQLSEQDNNKTNNKGRHTVGDARLIHWPLASHGHTLHAVPAVPGSSPQLLPVHHLLCLLSASSSASTSSSSLLITSTPRLLLFVDDDEQTHDKLTHPLRPGFRHHVVTESQPFRSPGRRTQRTRLVCYIIYIDKTEMETTLKGTNKKTDKRTLDYKIAHAHITHARD